MNQTVNSTCPACGEVATEGLMTVEQAPLSCAQLFPTREAAAAGGRCRVEILLCPACGHLWNATHEEGDTSIYNEQYYSSFTSSHQGREYQQKLANDLDRLIGVDGKTVVEIGCGDGFFLESLSKLGAAAIGFEPASTYELANKKKGIQVFNEEFQFEGGGRDIGQIDVVVMRHVLEHMPSAESVLASLRAPSWGSKAPKYLFLEVPNALQLLKDNLYFDFYNDHVHYFGQPSLSRMIDTAGWAPFANISSKDEFLALVCINPACQPAGEPSPDHEWSTLEPASTIDAAKRFKANLDEWKKQLTGLIDAQRDAGRTIAVWGAGARGVSLLCGLRLKDGSLAYAVDSDTNKHGKYLPVVNLSVNPVERLQKDPVDCVLVTSYTYFDEIVSQLDWFRSSHGKVIKVFPTPELV